MLTLNPDGAEKISTDKLNDVPIIQFMIFNTRGRQNKISFEDIQKHQALNSN